MTDCPPQVIVSVPHITVNPGYVLTVWLRKSKQPLEQIQVELRVKYDGTAELFCDGLDVKSFDDWTPM